MAGRNWRTDYLPGCSTRGFVYRGSTIFLVRVQDLDQLIKGLVRGNVAEGYPSPKAVVAGWMTSPGHRENIVSTTFTEMGAAVATARNGRTFYAQVFGRPRFGS